jgi:hypothetical protein
MARVQVKLLVLAPEEIKGQIKDILNLAGDGRTEV